MRKIVLAVGLGLSILKKHMFMVCMMMLLAALGFSGVAYAISYSIWLNAQAKAYTEEASGINYYMVSNDTGEQEMEDIDNNKDEIFNSYLSFRNSLMQCGEFRFTVQCTQPLTVTSCDIDDIFAAGYEYGYFEHNFVNTLSVSEKFFDIYSIDISEGSAFGAEEHLYKNDETIPVVLGSSYKDIFNVGDTFSGEYIYKELNFEVVGFAAENSFYWDYSEYVSLDRYIILPAFDFEGYDLENADVLWIQFFGLIESDKDYTSVRQIFGQLKTENGMEAIDINIWSTDDDYDSYVEVYSSMNDRIAGQYTVMAVLILVFAAASMIISICGMLKEKMYELGIHLLCGAGYGTVYGAVMCAVGYVTVPGYLITLAVMMLNGFEIAAVLICLALAAAIHFVCGFAAILYLKAMNISYIMGAAAEQNDMGLRLGKRKGGNRT